MSSFMRYGAVNTKIRAMEKRFLSNEDFINMLELKSISELASYLKSETHYSNVLTNIDTDSIHRRQLEVLIKKDHAMQIEKLTHYFYDGYRQFFKYVFVKREINELKSILRNINNNSNDKLTREDYPNVGLIHNINMDAILASKSIEDFVANLKGTVYYRYLKHMGESHYENRVFYGEMGLDLAYFDIFYSTHKDLEEEDRNIVEKLQGINADLLNIMAIYRGLKYFNISKEILFNYTIPHGFEFNRKRILDLCYSDNIDEFQQKINKTKYKFLFENENTKDIFMERRILRFQYFNIKDIERKREMNISGMLSFDLLLEYEIRDIVTVIESIRYEMPPDEAGKYLIRKI